MRHHSCDYCGKDLLRGDARYELSMEVRMVCDGAELTDDDLDDQDQLDPVDAMEDYLDSDSSLTDTAETPLPLPPMSKNFDLCGPCYRRILADPLGLDRAPRLLFSDN
jgi:hypothetical protein